MPSHTLIYTIKQFDISEITLYSFRNCPTRRKLHRTQNSDTNIDFPCHDVWMISTQMQKINPRSLNQYEISCFSQFSKYPIPQNGFTIIAQNMLLSISQNILLLSIPQNTLLSIPQICLCINLTQITFTITYFHQFYFMDVIRTLYIQFLDNANVTMSRQENKEVPML